MEISRSFRKEVNFIFNTSAVLRFPGWCAASRQCAVVHFSDGCAGSFIRRRTKTLLNQVPTIFPSHFLRYRPSHYHINRPDSNTSAAVTAEIMEMPNCISRSFRKEVNFIFNICSSTFSRLVRCVASVCSSSFLRRLRWQFHKAPYKNPPKSTSYDISFAFSTL
jgi:hypothetical protein